MNDNEPLAPEVAPKSRLDFAVVGVGASAGGIAALVRLFEGLPAEPNMAFVVVMHLSPAHDSSIAEVLQHATRMKVLQVHARTAIERDHVYVIPPGRDLAMFDGSLALQKLSRTWGAQVAIDVFFRSLADAHGDRAVGIVLSGPGTDGCVGISRL